MVATSVEPIDREWSLPSRRVVGMACLIATESALFAVFVIAYVFYIGKSLKGPFPADVLDLPVLSTIFLLSSSVTIVLAERALHSGRAARFNLMWLVTIVLGAAFLAMTAREWYHLIVVDHLTMATNLFGTTFYSLVGLHASHVIVGLVLLTIVFVFAVRGYALGPHAERIKMIAWYWHFVDTVWVVVFTVVYIAGR